MASNAPLIISPRPNAPSVAVTNDLRPIKPPIVIHNPWVIAAWTAGTLLAFALISLGIWALLKRRSAALVPVPIPPHVRARQKLTAALALIHDPRAFCIAVSDAIRVYLEERFDLRAPERTTEEFLRDLQTTTHLNHEQKQTLAAFLEQCDLVKFARFEPNETALRELHDKALRLVDETHEVVSEAAVPPPPPRVPEDAGAPVASIDTGEKKPTA